jgi:TatD DNase family protein
VTYKKTNLPDLLLTIPIEHIVLETDAPYLAPVPYRGKRNESSYIPIIADKIAEVYQLPLETIAALTSATAQKIFQ